MAYSLEELWKASPDTEIVDAVNKWPTLNDEAQRILRSEVKRRGLSVQVPEGDGSASTDVAPPKAFTPMTTMIVAVVFALVAVLAVVV